MKILNTKSVAALALGTLTLIGAPLFAATQNGTAPTENRQERRLEKRADGNAQARGGRGGVNRLMNQLNLSPEQKQQLRPIMKASREQTRTIRQNTTLTPDQKRQRMQEVRQSVQGQIASVLTPEQNLQFEQLQQQERAKKRQNRSQRGAKSAKGSVETAKSSTTIQ